MRKRVLIAASAVAALAGIPANGAMAAPPDRVGDDAFVCPVLKISDQAAENSDQFGPLGETGDYTILPGNAGDADTFNGNVPLDATNGDGDGTPGDDHVSPGDNDDGGGYSAVWSGN
jgi:hypothetical protein